MVKSVPGVADRLLSDGGCYSGREMDIYLRLHGMKKAAATCVIRVASLKLLRNRPASSDEQRQGSVSSGIVQGDDGWTREPHFGCISTRLTRRPSLGKSKMDGHATTFFFPLAVLAICQFFWVHVVLSFCLYICCSESYEIRKRVKARRNNRLVLLHQTSEGLAKA